MQVEKIHELREHLAAAGHANSLARPPRRVGVLNFRATRLLAFIVTAAAVLGCAVVCVLAIWEYVRPDFAWRGLASLGVISAATAIFVSLNEGFGPLVRE